jgi:antitoxin component of MazEF toxin-antitoxin module
MTKMGYQLTFTKRIAKSGRGYLVWIPKDVTEFLKISKNSTVEIQIFDLLNKNSNLTFTKKVSKSGKGYLIWIPKDVIDFLNLSEKSFVEIKIKKLKRISKTGGKK